MFSVIQLDSFCLEHVSSTCLPLLSGGGACLQSSRPPSSDISSSADEGGQLVFSRGRNCFRRRGSLCLVFFWKRSFFNLLLFDWSWRSGLCRALAWSLTAEKSHWSSVLIGRGRNSGWGDWSCGCWLRTGWSA